MALHPAYGQISALLTAVFILIAGNGLFSTLVPLRGSLEAFPDIVLGLLGSAYFAGMFFGCIAAPRIVGRAGHIRTFAALGAVATVTAIALPMAIEPWFWMLGRAVTGFCFAGLYATIESWLHDKAENVVRGQVMALYNIVHNTGNAAGQQAIRLADPMTSTLFSVVAAALSLAVLPLAFTRTDPPNPPPVPRLRLIWLYQISPVGVLGVLAAGAANGTMWSLGPIFAKESGLTAGGVASFMTAIILGGAIGQWPAGRLADRRDRRYVVIGAMAIAIAAELALVAFADAGLLVLVVLGAVIGAAALVLYPLCSSHAGDLAGRENAVEVSSALLLAYTIGAIVGPTAAATMMARYAPEAMFLHNAAIHLVLTLFIMWRLWYRPPVPQSQV
jgi:MFS family permease